MTKLADIYFDVKRLGSLIKRHASNVNKKGPTECWPWIGAKTKEGYGRMTAGRGVNLKSHRVAYLLAYGIFDEELDVCHHCDNPPCCNPLHLFVGTEKDNMQDAVSKGRARKPPVHFGEKHHNSRLSEEQVKRLLEDKRSYSVLAREYGISSKTVYRLKNFKTWVKLNDNRVTL